jgi:hypothetical protein
LTQSLIVPPARPVGGPSFDFNNTGSVSSRLTIPALRPRGEHSEKTNMVLVIRDMKTKTIAGTWTATAKGIHEQFSGGIEFTVGAAFDLDGPMAEVASKSLSGR